MYVPSNSPKYTCQKCRNKIGCADLEEIFLEEVKGYLVNPENVNSYLGKAGLAFEAKSSLLSQRQNALVKLTQDVDRMLRLYLDGSVTSEDFKRFNDPLSERRFQLEEETHRLQAEIDILRIDSLSGEQLVTEAIELQGRWPQMSQEERRKVIELMVRRIDIGEGELEFHLVQLPSYKEITNWQNTYPHGNTAVRSSTGNGGFVWP